MGPGWFLGFRRLSILDLSESAHQPMQFGDGNWLVYNGEIYNYRELRSKLRRRDWSSSGDTIVLGQLLEELGPEKVLPMLRGMFAFVWWDSKSRRAYFVRDGFGIKPLYYAVRGGRLLIASELRALKKLCEDNQLSDSSIRQYFRWGAIQSPSTILDDVKSLGPGEIGVWENGKVLRRKYFHAVWKPRSQWLTSIDDASNRLRSLVTESVKAHLVSDVPIGVFLSGGIDSSIVCGCLRELGVGRIRAFSVGFEDGSGVENESDAAGRTAEFYGADFERVTVTAKGLYEMYDEFIQCLDQPTAEGLNAMLVSRLAAKEVKVALTGSGADELFGGYNWMRMVHLARRTPFPWLGERTGIAQIGRVLQKKCPSSMSGRAWFKAAMYLCGINGSSVADMYASGRSYNDIGKLCKQSQAGQQHNSYPDDWEEQIADLAAYAPNSWIHKFLRLEMIYYLANTILRDGDCLSMASSLEVRTPYIDRELFAFASSLSPKLLVNARGGKLVLRRAFSDMLPPWIINDKKKKTFVIPLMKWLREEPWRSRIVDTLTANRSAISAYLDRKEMQRQIDTYLRKASESRIGYLTSHRVWLMFVLESWINAKLHSPTG